MCSYYGVHPKIFKRRIANTTREMSGRYHLKNKKLLRSVHDEILISKDGAGFQYHFEKPHSTHKVPINRLLKANGNQVEYSYDADNNLATVRGLNTRGGLFGCLKFKQHPGFRDTDSYFLEVEDSHLNRVSYTLRNVKSKKKKKWILEHVHRFDSPPESYRYDSDYERITRKELPEGRFLELLLLE